MKTRFTLAALILISLGSAAPAQVFHDLPGVVTTEEHEAEAPLSCTERYIPAPENSTRQRWGRTVTECTRGGMTYSGTGVIPSRERQLRGLDW